MDITIAKIAANYSLVAHTRVGLITIDTYRMAAVEQLRFYTKIIGLLLRVAFDTPQLKKAIKEMSDKKFILVDKADCNHHNTMVTHSKE